VSGAQCVANGTQSIENPANDNFQSSGSGVNWENAAVQALNGGVISGDALTITAPNAEEYGVWVHENGQVTLTGNSTIGGAHAVVASGANSRFTMTGGKIEASQQAIRLQGSVSVVLNNVDVVDTVQNDSAVWFDTFADGASFSMTGGSVSSSFGVMRMLGDNNSATFTGVTFDNTGGYGFLLESDAASGSHDTLTLKNVTLNHSGSTQAAINVRAGALRIDGADIVATHNEGISVLGTGTGVARVDAQNFSIQTSDNFSRGLGIQVGADSDVKLVNGTISTAGQEGHGIWLTASSGTNNVFNADAMTITASGVEASAFYSSWGEGTLTNSHLKSTGAGGRGIVSDANNAGAFSVVHMQGGDITVEGASSLGVFAAAGGEAHLDGVDITGAHASSIGFYSFWSGVGSFKNGTIDTQNSAVQVYWDNASMDIEASRVTSTGDGRFGLQVQQNASATVANGSLIDASGANSAALGFVGINETRTAVVNDSRATALGAGGRAIYAQGGVNRLDTANSTFDGDRLATLFNTASGGNVYGARLVVNADNSVFRGHTSLTDQSTLTLNLGNGSDWLLRPSSAGQNLSVVSFLNLNASRIRFAAPDPTNPVFQNLLVGGGNLSGATKVYNAAGNARVTMNTVLNAGGALADQFTDRLIVNGDASGTTVLAVNAVAGSPGALTGITASDGISLVQVYGNASESSFALAGGYVPIGAYEYRLHAFDPTASDASQRVLGSGGFWDFRLLSGFGRSGGSLLPQVPGYLAAPTALFHAQLMDIGTLHQRLGETRIPPDGERNGNPGKTRDAFLRVYGGEADYRSARHGVDTGSRYHAMQGGGNVYGVDNTDSRWRVGLAGSVGDVSFEPRHIDGSHKTRMDVWSVAPTVTWLHENGAYVDALTSIGGVKGDVANRGGVATTLKGRSIAASIEAGRRFELSAGLAVKPQVQAVYQRLRFGRLRDADNLAVTLGTLEQWRIRAGGEIGKIVETRAGHRIQVYGKAHVVHTLGDGQTVRMGDDRFQVGKSGTGAEIGVGVDALFANDRAVVYADATRQQRISRAGHAGWAVNLGARVRF